MPWVNPEHIKVPKIDWNDINSFDNSMLENQDGLDAEKNVKETEVEKVEDNEDE